MQIAQGCSAEQLESTIRAAGGQTEFFQVHFLSLFFFLNLLQFQSEAE